jgi:two-component system cell cycle response regulator
VATNAPSHPVDLQHLQLDDARALLDHGLNLSLPPVEASATAHLQAIIDGLCELSLKDPLTGLANRRHFRSVVDRAIDVVARSGEPALMLMLDIDHFKNVNDTHGHQAGDQVLQAIAKTLLGCVRPMDTVARLGGEEFAVMLPSCHTAYGSIVAERIRKAIETVPIQIAPGQTIQVTISIGGAFAPEWVRSTAALWSSSTAPRPKVVIGCSWTNSKKYLSVPKKRTFCSVTCRWATPPGSKAPPPICRVGIAMAPCRGCFDV